MLDRKMNRDLFIKTLELEKDEIQPGELYHYEEMRVLRPIIEILLNKYKTINKIARAIPSFKADMLDAWNIRQSRLGVLFKQRIYAFLDARKDSRQWSVYENLAGLREKLKHIKDFDTYKQDKADIIDVLFAKELAILEPILKVLDKHNISLRNLGNTSTTSIRSGRKSLSNNFRTKLLCYLDELIESDPVIFNDRARASIATLREMTHDKQEEARQILDTMHNIISKRKRLKNRSTIRKTSPDSNPAKNEDENFSDAEMTDTPTDGFVDTLPTTEPQIPDLTPIIPTEPDKPSLYRYLFRYGICGSFVDIDKKDLQDDAAVPDAAVPDAAVPDAAVPDEGLMKIYECGL